MKFCLGCMQEYDDTYKVCPYCGFIEGQIAEIPVHMNPGVVLKGENSAYTIGKVIGYGSFGVTYIARDNVLERRVAIKEYFPTEHATRVAGQNSISIYDDKHTQFCDGMEKFIDEARRLAKFENEEGIVKIFDHFYENDTAYIVMEYLDGITLSEYLEKNGIINPQMAVDMLMPIMCSLVNVHKVGIIHRDIAPDNIMITKDGKIKLIDFGAARYASSAHSKSLSVIVKQGYSPEEQYRRRSDQGAHTDVYSIAATLYKMITGKRPPDALERRGKLENSKKDILVPIRRYIKGIPRTIENAMYNALHIKIEDRTQNIEQLIEELTSEKPVKLRNQTISFIDRLGWKTWQIASIGAAAVMVVALIALLFTGVIHFANPFSKKIDIPNGMTRVPALVNLQLSSAETMVKDNSLLYTIEGKEYSNIIPKDYILYQSINPGAIIEINTMLMIKVSGGAELVEVPNILGIEKDKALQLLEKAQLQVKIVESYSNYIAEGYVVSQEKTEGVMIAKNSEIQVTISLGKDPNADIEEKEIIVPNFVGMKYQDVILLAADSELIITVYQHSYSEEFDKDIVMGQSVEAGTEISNLQPIAIEVSLGVKYAIVPDVLYFTEEQAVNKLEELDLVVTKLYKESETVKAGLVMSQSIASGEKRKSGSTIEITISKGRGSFAMPDVVGFSERNAVTELRGKGIAVSVSYAHNDKVASGSVISQSISAGTQVTGGTTVFLVVSTGEELYSVPNVLGKSEETAKRLLSNQNFSVSVSSSYSDVVNKGNVISQSLSEGGQYKKGTQIVIVVSNGKEPFTVTFDGNGGNVSENSRTIHYNDSFGLLPTVSRTGYTFEGWYTSINGGDKINSTSKYNTKSNQTLYAHWTPNIYTISFDSCGGNNLGTITVTYNSLYGILPVPKRNHYLFEGWFTQESGGSPITATTTVFITNNQTLYAHWTENEWSGWVTNKPSNDNEYEIKEKTQYSYRDKSVTTSSNSTLSGWIQDGFTWSDYSNWSDWSTTVVSGNDFRQVETTQETHTYETGRTLFNYHRWRYWNASDNQYWYTWHGDFSGSEYQERGWSTVELYLRTLYDGKVYGTSKNDPAGIWFYEEKKPETVTEIQTKYRYRDRNKVYHYYKWSNWTDYSDTAVTKSDTREVKTRIVYNYRLK